MKKDNEYEGYIYKATCKLNNKCYIGETIRSLKRRKTEHLSAARNKKHKDRNSYFYNAIRKYGEENFNWEIIKICRNIDKDSLYNELFELEISYIKEFDSFENGYNSNLGGIGSKGRIVSAETRKKLRDLQLGTKRSDESKERIRQAKLNISLSEGHKEKIKINTKIACENNPERSKKIKEGLQLGVNIFTEDGALINTFQCIKDGAKFYNVDPSSVTKNCKRIVQTCGKLENLRLIWRYKDDNFNLEDKKILKPIIVDIFDFENNFIKTFNCAKDVCDYYNITSSSTSNVLSGKTKYCKTKDGQKIIIKYKIFN